MATRAASVALLIALMGATHLSNAQRLFRQTAESYVSVAGTSSLHEWAMTSNDIRVQAQIVLNESGAPTSIQSFNLSLRAESLKSGVVAMDKNAYSTLNTTEHKNIQFEMGLTELTGSVVVVEGTLTVAGVSRKIQVEGSVRVLPDKSLLVTGTKKLKMSDFNIEPPTFMFGTVTTGDEVTITFNANLTPAKK